MDLRGAGRASGGGSGLCSVLAEAEATTLKLLRLGAAIRDEVIKLLSPPAAESSGADGARAALGNVAAGRGSVRD